MSASSDVAELPMRAVAGVPTRLPLTELDIACGSPYGEDSDGRAAPRSAAGLTARQALEEAILPALPQPPCVVSFPGGRDSSLPLAIATHLARREGLPDPIPATLCHPDLPSTKEDEWQQLVMRHLGVDDWVRIEVWDELELLGSVAPAAMQGHGLLWPGPTEPVVAGPHYHRAVPHQGDERLAASAGPGSRIRWEADAEREDRGAELRENTW